MAAAGTIMNIGEVNEAVINIKTSGYHNIDYVPYVTNFPAPARLWAISRFTTNLQLIKSEIRNRLCE